MGRLIMSMTTAMKVTTTKLATHPQIWMRASIFHTSTDLLEKTNIHKLLFSLSYELLMRRTVETIFGTAWGVWLHPLNNYVIFESMCKSGIVVVNKIDCNVM